MRHKKIITNICMLMITASIISPAYAESPPYQLPKYSEEEEIKIVNLDIDSAVNYGLENNTTIKILDNKIALAMITSRNAKENVEDLEDAKEKLKEANETLRSKQNQLNSAQNNLDTANSMLNAGITPVSVPLVDGNNNPITDGNGNQIILAPGTNIISGITALGIDSTTAAAMASVITDTIKTGLDDSQDEIDENSVAINEARLILSIKESEFDNVLKDTSEKLNTKIDYNSIIKLDVDDASDLMITMAGVNLEITKYAKDIYKNQIAMLIQKNYYDALYAKKVLSLKKIAQERGEKQYNIVKLSYENGMKSKEDLLLSKMYYDSTIISSRLAEANYNNSLFELKKNLNMDMRYEVILEDSMLSEVSIENLEEGLKSGLTNRIEIQQNLGELLIYELNEEIIKKMYKGFKKSDECEEAKLLTASAKLELEKTKALVSSEINQSYELMNATGEMLTASKELIENAQEVVTIAELKYEQGLGYGSALLADLNLQESSGTIIEVIASQEKLADIEAQVANIIYNYTMAKIKYFNDSGMLKY